MLSFVPAFLIFFSCYFQVPTGDWIPSASSSESDFFIKSKYISKVGSKITIWVKIVDRVPEEKEGKKMAYNLILNECDCNNYSYKNLSSVTYEENGDVITSFDFKDAEKKYAPPGSVSERFLNDICTRFNKKKK